MCRTRMAKRIHIIWFIPISLVAAALGYFWAEKITRIETHGFTAIGKPNYWSQAWTTKQELECGDICSYKIKEQRAGKYYPLIVKNVECTAIITRISIHKIPPPFPPKRIPEELYDAFTQNGELPVKRMRYINGAIKDAKHVISKFDRQYVDNLITQANAGKMILKGTYRVEEPINAFKKYSEYISGKRGLVIGSITPWLEALILTRNALHVTTLEYNSNIFDHPNLTKIHPYEITSLIMQNKVEMFDFAASYSSIEHSGLGRYGDPLDPYGDLEAVAQVWCMLKANGIYFLGIPETHKNTSYMEYNAHRVYGSNRLQHLTANFEVIDHIPESFAPWQGIWVLKKVEI